MSGCLGVVVPPPPQNPMGQRNGGGMGWGGGSLTWSRRVTVGRTDRQTDAGGEGRGPRPGVGPAGEGLWDPTLAGQPPSPLPKKSWGGVWGWGGGGQPGCLGPPGRSRTPGGPPHPGRPGPWRGGGTIKLGGGRGFIKLGGGQHPDAWVPGGSAEVGGTHMSGALGVFFLGGGWMPGSMPPPSPGRQRPPGLPGPDKPYLMPGPAAVGFWGGGRAEPRDPGVRVSVPPRHPWGSREGAGPFPETALSAPARMGEPPPPRLRRHHH